MASPALSFGQSAPDLAGSPLREPATSAEREIHRLANLHREAEETARLANLLGRAPYAAVMLAVASGLTAALAILTADNTAITAWLVLMLIGTGALARGYGIAIRAPFERAPLMAFSQDLTAILTYCGFAWGAGAFLALPADTGPFAALAFAVLPAAMLAGLLRTHAATLGFLAPVAVMVPLAMLLRPLPQGVIAATLTLTALGLIAGAALWSTARGRTIHGRPHLAGLHFS